MDLEDNLPLDTVAVPTGEPSPWQPVPVTVRSVADYEAAGARRAAIKAYLKGVHDYWDKDIDDAFQHHRNLCAKRKRFLDPAETEERQLKDAMDVWLNAEDARRRAEQAAIEAEARRRAEDERLAAAEALANSAPGDAHVQAAAESLLAEEIEIAPSYLAPVAPKIAGLRAPSRRRQVEIDTTAVVLAVAAGLMLDALDAVPSTPHAAAVRTFLNTFQPARNMAWAVTVNEVAIRRAATNGFFKLAGVTTGSKLQS